MRSPGYEGPGYEGPGYEVGFVLVCTPLRKNIAGSFFLVVPVLVSSLMMC